MNVKISPESANLLPQPEDYPNMIPIDFATALPLRQQITDQFIRDYGQ